MLLPEQPTPPGESHSYPQAHGFLHRREENSTSSSIRLKKNTNSHGFLHRNKYTKMAPAAASDFSNRAKHGELRLGGISCDKKKLKVFNLDPFDYQSILDALKGHSGLFYSFEIFNDSLKFIDEHNALDRPYKVSLNAFADQTTKL
ncbi:hypothetical protein C1H46_019470 [Malus baccata]|uniref:Cathepsin propeptide inhibitor domain-containing protein n=1 Tax=Malus baccata TaxID=106549 RepID=A0A540M841_MALBA|nr:hypothetical protein C1H46_019470 [Malus baccata]